MQIRELVGGDRAAWEPLWQAYLAFYRQPLDDDITAATFDRLTDGRDGLAGLLAVTDGVATGIAHTVTHASTWATGPSVYLEDLYVAPTARGSGTARALIEAVTDRAHLIGAANLYWMTQEYNAPARSLYDRIAARTSFVVYTRGLG
jgi:GNAT superfamily N-acetyltransferase